MPPIYATRLRTFLVTGTIRHGQRQCSQRCQRRPSTFHSKIPPLEYALAFDIFYNHAEDMVAIAIILGIQISKAWGKGVKSKSERFGSRCTSVVRQIFCCDSWRVMYVTYNENLSEKIAVIPPMKEPYFWRIEDTSISDMRYEQY